MGQIIDAFQLQQSGSAGLLKPLIFCNPSEELTQKAIFFEGLMTEKLLARKPKFRNKRVDV